MKKLNTIQRKSSLKNIRFFSLAFTFCLCLIFFFSNGKKSFAIFKLPTLKSVISLLIPAPNPSDFASNSSQYQLQVNTSNGWVTVSAPATNFGNDVVGFWAPVTTFNAQYAVVKQNLPSSDFFNNPVNPIPCNALTSFGVASTEFVTVGFLTSAGTQTVAGWGATLSPGNYSWQFLGFPASNPTEGTFTLHVQMGGKTIITSDQVAFLGGC